MESHQWDERYATSELIWTAEPNRFLVEEVAGLQPGRALDVACGEGRNAVWLAQQGWRVVGVDFSEEGLRKGRALAEARGVEVDWVHADVTTYEPDAQGFELVVLLYLQLPEEPLSTVLRAASEAVAPGGTLLVVAHDLRNLTEGHGGPQHPSVLYGPDDVVASLVDLGVERAEQVERPVETDDGTKTAIDLLVRASRPTG